jgi:hypothetical protein
MPTPSRLRSSKATTPSPRSASRRRPLRPSPPTTTRMAPPSMPHSPARSRPILERRVLPPTLLPCRPPAPAAAVSVLVLSPLTLDLLDPPDLSESASPVYHQPSFLFGPRPRSRTPMVRGRGRGPNRPRTPVDIGQPQPVPPDPRSGVQSGGKSTPGSHGGSSSRAAVVRALTLAPPPPRASTDHASTPAVVRELSSNSRCGVAPALAASRPARVR